MFTVQADRKALARFTKDLNRLSRDLGAEDGKSMRSEMRAGAKDAAEIVAAEARRRAPEGEDRFVYAQGEKFLRKGGRLKKSIKPSVDLGRGRVAVVAGVPQRDRFKGSVATRYRRAYQAGWVEFGHDINTISRERTGRMTRGGFRAMRKRRTRIGRVPGQFYLSGAMEAKQDAALRAMAQSLDDIIRKYNRKFARRR